tara:strand:- start:70006 stop:70746 length:741 start_codon:yes stop_codon:yes gene_type:complete
MIKSTLLFLLIVLHTNAGNIPAPENNDSQDRFKLNTFYKTSMNSTAIFKADYFKASKERTEKSYQLEYRYRLKNYLKVGGYIKYLIGKRYDNDWVKSGTWHWQDTSSRDEYLLGLNANFRYLAKNIRHLILDLRITNEHNLRNSENHFILRPGFTKIFLHKSRPVINYFLQYELILPTNYSEEAVSESWIYTGFLWHLNNKIKPGIFYQKGVGSWSSSKDFKDNVNSKYSIDHKYSVYGVSLNLYF